MRPAGILSLQAHDRGFDGRRQPIRLPVRAVASIAERLDPAVFVAVEDLVAGLARNSELGAQRRHLLALEQAGDKPEPLVHDVTLLPRHARSCEERAKVSPIRSEYAVTYRSGRTEFRGDTGVTAPTLSSATSLIPTTALRVPRRMRCLSLTPHVPRPQPRHHGRMRHASAFVELGDACVNFVDAPALGIAVASDRFSRVQFRTASLHRYTSVRSPIFTTTTISWSSRIW